MSLKFDTYGEWRLTFDVARDSKDLVYPALGLNGEAGEVAEKVKKILRDKGGVVDEDSKQAILLECGDVLWYLDALAYRLDSSLSEVAEMNIQKLQSRMERGTLKGNGDDR